MENGSENQGASLGWTVFSVAESTLEENHLESGLVRRNRDQHVRQTRRDRFEPATTASPFASDLFAWPATCSLGQRNARDLFTWAENRSTFARNCSA